MTDFRNINNLDNCSICLDPMRLQENLVKTDCNHIFHRACINGWQALENSCPLDRHEITELQTYRMQQEPAQTETAAPQRPAEPQRPAVPARQRPALQGGRIPQNFQLICNQIRQARQQQQARCNGGACNRRGQRQQAQAQQPRVQNQPQRPGCNNRPQQAQRPGCNNRPQQAQRPGCNNRPQQAQRPGCQGRGGQQAMMQQIQQRRCHQHACTRC